MVVTCKNLYRQTDFYLVVLIVAGSSSANCWGKCAKCHVLNLSKHIFVRCPVKIDTFFFLFEGIKLIHISNYMLLIRVQLLNFFPFHYVNISIRAQCLTEGFTVNLYLLQLLFWAWDWLHRRQGFTCKTG